MAKPKVKAVEEAGQIPEGVKIIDLSQEKRIELYQKALAKFDKEGSEVYGISIAAQLKYTAQGIIPSLSLVDLLSKRNNETQTQEGDK